MLVEVENVSGHQEYQKTFDKIVHFFLPQKMLRHSFKMHYLQQAMKGLNSMC